jgi:hypothetical protein
VEMHGAHTGGPLFGVPPTGEQVEFEQFHIVQFGEHGLGIRHWANVGVEQFLLTAATRAEPSLIPDRPALEPAPGVSR